MMTGFQEAKISLVWPSRSSSWEGLIAQQVKRASLHAVADSDNSGRRVRALLIVCHGLDGSPHLLFPSARLREFYHQRPFINKNSSSRPVTQQ